MQPKKYSFNTLSNEALCKLRDEIADLLNSRAEALRREADQLTGGPAAGGDENGGEKATSRRVAPKYRGPHGETWTGRGLKPRWLNEAINEGMQPSDFLIDKELKTAPVEQTRQLRSVDGSPVRLFTRSH
jgi:DNA-binding protein H-NS